MRDLDIRGKDIEQEEREKQKSSGKSGWQDEHKPAPHEHLPRMTAEFQTPPTRSLSHVSTPLTHTHIKHCFHLLHTDLTVSDDL